MKGVRIGIGVGAPFDGVHADVARLHADAVVVLRDLGAETVELETPIAVLANDLQQTLIKPEISMMMSTLLNRGFTDISREVLGTQDEGYLVPATRYLEAKALRAPLLEEHVRDVFGKVDVLFTPALGGPVPTVEEMATPDVCPTASSFMDRRSARNASSTRPTPTSRPPTGTPASRHCNRLGGWLLTTGFTETTRGSHDPCSRSLGGLGDLVGSNAFVQQDGLATTEQERVRARIRGGRRGGVPSPPRRGTGRPR